MDDPVLEMAESLKRRRLRQGWSAQDLARATVSLAAELGDEITLSQQAISQFENMKLKGVPRWLRYASAALEVDGLPEPARATTLSQLFGRPFSMDQAISKEDLKVDFNWVSLRVPLPSETALAAMFEGQLSVLRDLHGADLACALARRLPAELAKLMSTFPEDEHRYSKVRGYNSRPLGD